MLKKKKQGKIKVQCAPVHASFMIWSKSTLKTREKQVPINIPLVIRSVSEKQVSVIICDNKIFTFDPRRQGSAAKFYRYVAKKKS